MADFKSCEGKVTTLECMECGHRETFTERQFKTTDGLRCYVCNGIVKPVITMQGEKINNRRMTNKARSIGKLIVDIDVSEAIKGLKAVERQAKKTARALKEVEFLRNKSKE